MRRFILVISIFFSEVHCELFTLKNRTHIHCTDSDIYSPIYVWPPPEINYEKPVKNGKWSEDWIQRDPTNLAFSPVLDRRWSDFSIIPEENYLRFNLNTSISVSVYSPGEIKIFAFNEEESVHKTIKTNEKWHHFTVLAKNNSVYIFQNGKIIKFKHNFKPETVVFQSSYKTYWKLHKYNFMWSNQISDDELSYLKIPSTKKTCLLLYTSLCRDCFLEVETHKDKKTHITQLKSKEAFDKLNHWQIHQFYINANEVNLIKFIKRKIGEDSEGYWAVDYDFCDSLNIISYRDNSLGSEYKCESLNKNDNINKDVFNCKPGTFGKNCEHHCESIFGSDYSYCEGHKICSQSTCKCAWGANGDFCDKQCPVGKFGISCQNECPENCKICDIKAGECPIEQGTFTQTVLWHFGIVFISILFVSLLVVFIIAGLLWSNSQNQKISEEEKKILFETNRISSIKQSV